MDENGRVAGERAARRAPARRKPRRNATPAGRQVTRRAEAAPTGVPAAAGAGVPGGDEALSLLFEASELALILLDPSGRVRRWSRGAERLLGHGRDEMTGQPLPALLPPGGAAARNRLPQPERGTAPDNACWLVRRDGSRLWAEVISSPLRDGRGELRGYVCIVRDADARPHTERALRETARQLEELAATDPLTGLRNRRDFDRMLATVPRERFAVLAIDVDHLKEVNDEQGHEAGDDLLRSVAGTLSLLVRGWDVLARIGGDEFGVILPGAGPDEAAAVAERMRRAVDELPSGAAGISVGWCAGPPGADLRLLWSAADRALYMAKREGGDRVVGRELIPGGPSPRRPGDGEVLSAALAERSLSVVYQPIVDLRDGRPVGYEALARPARFGGTDSVAGMFRAARETGRIRDLDWICRRLALRDSRRLPAGATLFLNVSTAALLDRHHPVDQMLLLLRWAGWPPERTVLELSERERISDRRRLLAVLAAYRAAGFRFAMDDVGEDPASLEILALAAPEYVKVSGRLAEQAPDAATRAILDAVLADVELRGATAIAEGVEDPAAAERMRSLGFTVGQGFALGPPTPTPAGRPRRPRRTRATHASARA